MPPRAVFFGGILGCQFPGVVSADHGRSRLSSIPLNINSLIVLE